MFMYLYFSYVLFISPFDPKDNERVGWFMVFNPTFNDISVISWQSVLLVEETRAPAENHRPVTSHWQTLSHNVVSSTPRHERDSNSQLQWWWALSAQVVVNPTTIRSQPWRSRQWKDDTSDMIIKDKVLIMVGCPIFPSTCILIAKYLFTGSLKKNQLII